MLNNPAEKAITLDQSVQTFDQLDKGFIPGYGAAQIDTFPQEDNVDATHPLNVDYFLPGNFQRLLGARLSFKLRRFRGSLILSTAARSDVQTNGTLINVIQADTLYRGSTDPLTALTNATLVACCGTNVLATPVTRHSFIDATLFGGNPTTNNVPWGGNTSATCITSVTASDGVGESSTVTNVSVSIDGTDVTALLTPAGPYTADQVEIDLRPVMTAARITPKVFHVIQLTPSGLPGRIHAFLRFTYFVNGQIA
jgi:hypothetical protein